MGKELFAFVVVAAAGEDIIVDVANGVDSSSCGLRASASACASIKAAIAVANVSEEPTVLRVRRGTYHGMWKIAPPMAP